MGGKQGQKPSSFGVSDMTVLPLLLLLTVTTWFVDVPSSLGWNGTNPSSGERQLLALYSGVFYLAAVLFFKKGLAFMRLPALLHILATVYLVAIELSKGSPVVQGSAAVMPQVLLSVALFVRAFGSTSVPFFSIRVKND